MECSYCGSESQKLVKDHIVPVSKGGTSLDENLVLCCRRCNEIKRDKMPNVFLDFLIMNISKLKVKNEATLNRMNRFNLRPIVKTKSLYNIKRRELDICQCQKIYDFIKTSANEKITKHFCNG